LYLVFSIDDHEHAFAWPCTAVCDFLEDEHFLRTTPLDSSFWRRQTHPSTTRSAWQCPARIFYISDTPLTSSPSVTKVCLHKLKRFSGPAIGSVVLISDFLKHLLLSRTCAIFCRNSSEARTKSWPEGVVRGTGYFSANRSCRVRTAN
jgi:hypothetical protein